MTALVTKKKRVLTLNCPYSEGPLRSECSDWLPMAMSLHRDCPDIKCPHKECLLYQSQPCICFVQGDKSAAGQAAAKAAADKSQQAGQKAAAFTASGWGAAPVLVDQPAASQPPQPAGKDANQSAGRTTKLSLSCAWCRTD